MIYCILYIIYTYICICAYKHLFDDSIQFEASLQLDDSAAPIQFGTPKARNASLKPRYSCTMLDAFFFGSELN